MSRFGYVTYCEDIRTEVSNQYSMIGVFQGGIGVPSVPGALPKIAACITWIQSGDEDRLPVTFRVFFIPDGQEIDGLAPLIEGTMDIGQPGFREINDESQFLLSEAHIIIAPLGVPSPGRLGVRLYRGDEMHKLRALNIMLNPQAEQAQHVER